MEQLVKANRYEKCVNALLSPQAGIYPAGEVILNGMTNECDQAEPYGRKNGRNLRFSLHLSH